MEVKLQMNSNTANLPEFLYVRDLQFYEGTLLAYYQAFGNIQGEFKDEVFHYILFWLDIDNEAGLNRWMFFETNKEDLNDFENGIINLYEFIKKGMLRYDFKRKSLANSKALIFDANEYEIIRYTTLKFEDLPDDYMPDKKDSYFAKALAPVEDNSLNIDTEYLNEVLYDLDIVRTGCKKHNATDEYESEAKDISEKTKHKDDLLENIKTTFHQFFEPLPINSNGFVDIYKAYFKYN